MLDPKTAHELRVTAAKADTTMSPYVARLIEQDFASKADTVWPCAGFMLPQRTAEGLITLGNFTFAQRCPRYWLRVDS